MSLKKYMAEISPGLPVSEIAFYTPLSIHILRRVLGYSAKGCLINKAGEVGIPDVRLLSEEDASEWVICEAKLYDAEIRDERKRAKLWQDQIIEKGYLSPETVYVLLCSPRTFYVCDVTGELVEAVHLDPPRMVLTDFRSGEEVPATDLNLRKLLWPITAQASRARPQYEVFRRGGLKSGFLPLEASTLSKLQDVFEFSIRLLKRYCKRVFEWHQQQYKEYLERLRELEIELGRVGSDFIWEKKVRRKILQLKKDHEIQRHLFEVDYPLFKEDQTYSGTKEEREEDFEDIFVTNTSHIALSRLFFVRICEDTGLTSKKISNEGMKVWSRFVLSLPRMYKAIIELAFEDVMPVYAKLFESSVFDWFGTINHELNDILERILFRLNAFSLARVDRDTLGTMYQYFRPRAERKRLGEYYTDEAVVDFVLSRCGIFDDPDILTKRILDPACGSFTFGVRAFSAMRERAKHLSPQNKIELARRCISGYDINPFSTFLAHLSMLFACIDLYLEAKKKEPGFQMPPFSVSNINSLTSAAALLGRTDANEKDVSSSSKFRVFDYVVGNPPFVRNERIPPGDRAVIEQTFAAVKSGNTDLSVYFIYCALSVWLKDGGVMGMLAPIALANTKMAAPLRALFRNRSYHIREVVSLEWMAKEIFPGADIIPMIMFSEKGRPPARHSVNVVSGLRSKEELRRAVDDPKFLETHTSRIDYRSWLDLSPVGDWPLEVKEADVPILQKLRSAPTLSEIARTSFGVKLGAGAKIVLPAGKAGVGPKHVQFLKGQHICAFGLSQPQELIDLHRIGEASDGSIWRDMSFYERSRDANGTLTADSDGASVIREMNRRLPSDTACCLLPTVYVTLNAAVADPLHVCANNSAMVVVPLKYDAHTLCALINSTISRYYAFLLFRTSILLRRRSTWVPRVMANLPLPKLDARTAKKLGQLSREATRLSEGVALSVAELFSRGMAGISDMTKAGFLGVKWSAEDLTLSRQDFADSTVRGKSLSVATCRITSPDGYLPYLIRAAFLAQPCDEIAVSEIQNIPLPADPDVRSRLAGEIKNFEKNLDSHKKRMEVLCHEIDVTVGEGLGLSASELAVILKRCQEFPLSETVARPRYVWSADRKVQARRLYEKGERFQ